MGMIRGGGETRADSVMIPGVDAGVYLQGEFG